MFYLSMKGHIFKFLYCFVSNQYSHGSRKHSSWAWWPMPVIPEAQEAAAGVSKPASETARYWATQLFCIRDPVPGTPNILNINIKEFLKS